MSRPITVALFFGFCLSLFTAAASASLSLSLSVSSGPASHCFGNPTDNFWDFTAATSAGDTGPMFFTIYDVGVPCTVEPSGSPKWTVTGHLLGTTPAGLSPPDDQNIANYTFDCLLTTNCTPATNAIILPYATGCFAYSWQDYDAAGALQSGTGRLCAPGTPTAPEPATLALLGLGLAGLAASRRRELN